PVLAQDAERALLVVDPDNAESRYVANYYAAARGIPGRNVIPMDPIAANYSTWTQVQQAGFFGALRKRGIEDTIDFVILPPGHNFYTPASGHVNDTCFPVTRFAAPSPFTIARQSEDILAGVNSSETNHFADNAYGPRAFQSKLTWRFGDESTAGNAEGYFLGAMLGWTGMNGNTLQEVLDMIDRSVAVDGTAPAGTFYFCETNDQARSGPRHDHYPNAVANLATWGGQGQHLLANLPTGFHDCLGVMTGLANPAIDDPAFTLLDGAFADHLTSYAATFTNNSQTKMSRWIAKGASGTSGTVEEPCAYAGKFAHARVHNTYFRGLTLGEAWLRSHGFKPFQSLLIADPLTRPWGQPPTVDVTSPPTGPQSGTVVITPTASAVGGANTIVELTLFVDGEPLETIASGSFSLDTTAFADGWHELRIRAVDGKIWRNQASWVGSIDIDNHAGAVTLSSAGVSGDLGTAFTFDHVASGKTILEVVLLQHERVIASSTAATGSTTVFGQNTGAGAVRVVAEARFDDGTTARSLPVELDVTYAGGGGGAAAPTAFDFCIYVREDQPFLLQLPGAFDDDPSTVTTSVLTAPAQSALLGGEGSWRVFDPSDAALGSDSLTYQVTGAGGTSNTGTITIEYVDVDGCLPVQRYCIGAPNSAGAGAVIDHTGSVSVAANDFNLQITGAPDGEFGLFFYGIGQVQNTLGDGFLCVGSNIGRFPVVVTDVAGAATQWVDFDNLPGAGVDIQPGTTCTFQFWYRDPGFGGTGSNLSDGIEATFCN
ncbi:MAG: TIGR03790 family protein, partial [Planctomycetota bacterium]|nr:TIGR03790 family protein [Planctomycetota bacterium]